MKSFIAGVLLVLSACAAYGFTHDYPSEPEVCKVLANEYSAIIEYRCYEGSRVDLLTANEAIEVDWAPKWKEAVGQALLYSELTNKKPAIILLVRNQDLEEVYLLRCQIVCTRVDIRLYIEHVKPK